MRALQRDYTDTQSLQTQTLRAIRVPRNLNDHETAAYVFSKRYIIPDIMYG